MPGLFDIQVNGYGGVDFNSDTIDDLAILQACQRLEADGVESILATIISADVESMCRRIGRIARAVAKSPEVARVIRGIHIEGPFLRDQAGYIGTHPVASAQPATPDVADRLLEAGEGLVRLVTLAPERDAGFATTRWLAEQGVVVSAGHCDPTLDELRGAIDNGLSMFTHLGNGCPKLMDRHDNVVQRVLSVASDLWVCFIADGVHVPLFALCNYLDVVGIDRAIVVSDAISAAGQGPGVFALGDMQVVVDENLATWSADRQHLMGSACPLPRAMENLVERVGLTRDEAELLTSANPRQALKMDAYHPVGKELSR
ncbi:N-acetylglucosamine-6-phosphate deacetylase [Aeoliella sp. SH292]|uniref:N-acetylglucosamine-6-phosphate deacetylase n=1 Tax=Aeoliella sp. SH292 TaxID=3454464 RepID=UPI003F9D441F